MKKFLSTLAIAGVATLALASCNGGDATSTSTKATPTTTTGVTPTTTETGVTPTTTETAVTPTTTETGVTPTTTARPEFDYSELEDRHITIWVSEVDGVAEETQEKAEAYLASIGLDDVEVEVAGVSEGNAASTVVNDLDSAADIYCIAQDQLANLVTAGAAVMIRPEFEDGVRSRNDVTSVKAATIGDGLAAYPITSDNGYVMYYNKADLEGVDVNCLEDILAKCESLGTHFCYDLKNVWYSAGFFFGTGCYSSWVTDENGEFTQFADNFNSDEGLIALKGMYKILKSTSWYNASSAAEFDQATKASVVVTGPWDTTVAQGILGDNYGVVKLPCYTVDGEEYQIGSFSGCKLMCVKPQEDAAKLLLCNELANYLSDEECSLARYKKFAWGPSNLAAQQNADVKADAALSAIAAQNEFATPQGQILGAWWAIGNSIAVNAADTDGSDDALKAVLKTYEDELIASFEVSKLTAPILVGAWNGWNNADPTYMMEEVSDGVYTFTVEVAASLEYKGGRIVVPAKWETVAGWDQVAADSLVYLNPAEAENSDRNLVFAEAGTYTITWDEATETITIEKA